MNKLMLALSLVLSFGSISSFASLSEYLEKAQLHEKIKEKVATLDIRADLKILDLDIAEGVGISSKYRYQVEQSEISNLEARVDKWIINTNLNPGDIIKDELDLPIFMNIKKGAEVHFVRQFKSRKEALKAIPYTLAKLPTNSERALKLNPGDFVSIPTNMSVVTGVSTSALSNYVHAGAKAYAAFNGEYLVHIFKMKDSKVRLKIIAQRKQDYQVDGQVKFDYDLFGVGILDKQVERIFDFTLVDLGAGIGHGQQLLIDYIFDLKDSQARLAYDNILGSTFKFKDVEIFKDFFKERGLEERLYSTYEAADDLAKEDANKEMKRVERIFLGFNNYDKDSRKLKFSLLFAKFGRNWNYLENHINYEDLDGNNHSFYYPTYNYSKEQKIGFGSLSTKEVSNDIWFGLVPEKNEETWSDFSDFGISYSRKDQIFRFDEQVKFSQKIRDLVPSKILEKIDLTKWEDSLDKSNANINIQVILKKEFLEDLKGLSVKDIQVKLYEFYKNRKTFELIYIDGFFKKIWKKMTLIQKSERQDIKDISAAIYKLINDETLTGKDRLKIIFKLKERSVFNKIGQNFLISLIKEEDLQKYLFVKVSLGAKDLEEINYTFGERRDEELYKQLDYINRILNDRSYDLRLSKDQLLFD